MSANKNVYHSTMPSTRFHLYANVSVWLFLDSDRNQCVYSLQNNEQMEHRIEYLTSNEEMTLHDSFGL